MAVDLAELLGEWNFRDIAESTGVQPGLLFRSSDLIGLDERGPELVTRLGITDVADLRSPREVERSGPVLMPEGVEVHRLPFVLGATVDDQPPPEVTLQRMITDRPDGEDIFAAARRLIIAEYVRFATLDGAKYAVQQVISLISDERRLVAHCFAGKDRTGFLVATVLEAGGVERDAIVSDYLRSNAAVPQLRVRMESLRDRSNDTHVEENVLLNDEVLSAREDYLDAARRTLEEEYGSLRGYLASAGVTDGDIARLRAVLRG